MSAKNNMEKLIEKYERLGIIFSQESSKLKNKIDLLNGDDLESLASQIEMGLNQLQQMKIQLHEILTNRNDSI